MSSSSHDFDSGSSSNKSDFSFNFCNDQNPSANPSADPSASSSANLSNVNVANSSLDFDRDFVMQNLMGPNVVLMFDELFAANAPSPASDPAPCDANDPSPASDPVQCDANAPSPASDTAQCDANDPSPASDPAQCDADAPSPAQFNGGVFSAPFEPSLSNVSRASHTPDSEMRDLRICDLGCGAGLSSLAIARASNATVFAVDSWNWPEENRRRFDAFPFGNRIVAIQADAPELPFDEDYFDMLICLDSYNYFGREEGVIDKVASYVKPGGKLLLGISGVKREPTAEDMRVFGLSWTAEQMDYIRTVEWWRGLFSKSDAVRIDEICEMSCHGQAWRDWLTCDNEYAQGDRAACEAGAIDLMCTIGVVLTRVGDRR